MYKRTFNKLAKILSIIICGVAIMMIENSTLGYSAVKGPVEWGSIITIDKENTFTDTGKDARSIDPGQFGSEYARLLKLKNGTWIAVYTIYPNNGYLADPKGGTQLQIASSNDNCKSWRKLAIIRDSGRDLDNGQMIELKNGEILLACRSVRWQESYMLPVYKSKDFGKTWERLSVIDENNGKPGELGFPDKGVYEPHFYMLDDGSLSVMYANEKHVTETPSYSQIISQKITKDNGKTWGKEIFVAWDPDHSDARPGMPVWTKMKNGKFIVCFEVVGTENVDIFCKISDDGKTWTSGIGKRIEGQKGGPCIITLNDGRLVVTSNTHNISISDDDGKTWYQELDSPFGSLFEGADNVWPSLYEIDGNKIAAVTSSSRQDDGVGGHYIALKFGTWNNKKAEINSSSDYWLISRAQTIGLQAIKDDTMIKYRIADYKDRSQSWKFIKLAGGYYKIVDKMNRVLTMDTKNSNKDIIVSLKPWGNKETQKWKVSHMGGGNYVISNAKGKYLSCEGQDSNGNAILKLLNFSGEDNQRWELYTNNAKK